MGIGTTEEDKHSHCVACFGKVLYNIIYTPVFQLSTTFSKLDYTKFLSISTSGILFDFEIIRYYEKGPHGVREVLK